MSTRTELWSELLIDSGCVAFPLAYRLDTVENIRSSVACLVDVYSASLLSWSSWFMFDFRSFKSREHQKNCLNIESGRRNLYLRKTQNFFSIILPQSSVFYLHLVLLHFHFHLYFHLQLHLTKWSLHLHLVKIILASEVELQTANNIVCTVLFTADGPGPAESGKSFLMAENLFFDGHGGH